MSATKTLDWTIELLHDATGDQVFLAGALDERAARHLWAQSSPRKEGYTLYLNFKDKVIDRKSE